MLPEARGLTEGLDPITIFQDVKSLCVISDDIFLDGRATGPLSAFSGPLHLASLLIAVAGDLSESAVVTLPPPQGLDPERWQSSLKAHCDDYGPICGAIIVTPSIVAISN